MEEAERKEIINLYKQGIPKSRIAKQFNRCDKTITKVVEDIEPPEVEKEFETKVLLKGWDAICKSFKNVKWVKRGGKKLWAHK